jgi:hypothetical protein
MFAPQLIAAFHNSAGNIVDAQIEWKPDQDGRWDIPPIKDCPADAPQIQFSGFAPETTLTLRSANHNVVELGLNPAALAISLVAWNWVMWSATDAGNTVAAKQAQKYYEKLRCHIFGSRHSALSEIQKQEIARYID